MVHSSRLARASALSGALLAAGFLWLPTFASPLFDDPVVTATDSEAPTPAEVSDTATAATGTVDPGATPEEVPTASPTLSPSPTAVLEFTGTAEPASPEASPDTSETPPETLSLLPSDTATAAEEPTGTPTSTSEPTPTPESSATPSATMVSEPSGAMSYSPGSVLINEVAWAGTLASTSDEWIELWNPGPDSIDLEGWRLVDNGDIAIALSGVIEAHGFYLLERSDDDTVADITADKVYTGSLNNGGQTLELLDPSDALIDTANASGGPWPGGNTTQHASMERHGALDVPGSWSTFPGTGGNGLDAAGNPIAGTPRQPNAPSSPPFASPTPSATPTPTTTPPGPAATPFPHEAVIINEVAWAGTLASTSDEWIELLNPGSDDILLDGWTLTDDGDVDISLRGILASGNYYVLERSDDQTISDQAADQIYAGALSNQGETLRLIDPSGAEIDVVNPGGGAWPAGDASGRSSMERVNGTWRTFTGPNGLGRDAAGQAVRGTPHGPNSTLLPTPLPTWIPGRVVINEVLVRPHYDWEGAGGVTTADEFIELYNRGPGRVNLKGWILDDYVVGGSAPYELPSMTLEPGGFAAFFRSHTHIALNDDGDSIRLSAPDGSLVDKIRYLRVEAYNLSYGRLPDGDDVLVYGLWPTPGKKNVLYTPPGPFPAGSILINEVAWAGTLASANDEWIELWNPGAADIHLDGWILTDDNDVHIDLTGIVPAGGFAILERTDDGTLSDIPADSIYTGALADSGEQLRLIDPTGKEIDVVNPTGAAWPAGDSDSRASMERFEGRWVTFSGDLGRTLDADGRPVAGTPGGSNPALVDSMLCSPGSPIFRAPTPGEQPCP